MIDAILSPDALDGPPIPSIEDRLQRREHRCIALGEREAHPAVLVAGPNPSVADEPSKDEAEFASAEMLYIDPDTCIDCGLCVDECPVTAIFPQEDLPAEWAEFIEKNTAYYKK